jgi:RecA/RadA recombinase
MNKNTAETLAAFGKFNDRLEKETKGRVKLRGFSDIDEFIHTGNFLLNAQMSGSLRGGYPNARSLGVSGDSGTGKTFLAMNAVYNAQKQGYVAFYIDSEGALDSKDFENFGIDMNLLNYKRMAKISEVKFYINDIIKTAEANPGLKIMLIVDSLTHLNTDKEVNDISKGSNAQDMGLRAKELRALFKSFTLDLSNLKIPLIFTAHNYAGQDQYAGKTMSGGGGPLYAASVVMMLAKGHLKDDENDEKKKTGVVVRSNTDKNRLAKPERIEFHISFHKGMNPYVGLQDYISWDTCGVGRGSVISEREFGKLSDSDKKDCRDFEREGKKVYFQPKKSARNYINKWTGESIPWREIFTDKVFTDKVLDELDENVIKPKFKYSSLSEVLKDELEELEDSFEKSSDND